LAGIDLSNQKKWRMSNYKNLNDSFSGKKSPVYGKRNMSLNNHRTFDEVNALNPNTANLLDVGSRNSLIG
jgi:hypothetical protein